MRHRFLALTWERTPVLGRWKCQNCSMKVKDRTVAERLENSRCDGTQERGR
jgi:hypothetical protein